MVSQPSAIHWIPALFLAMVAASFAQTTPNPVVLPSLDRILATLAPGHPRLLLADSALPALTARISADSQAGRWYAEQKSRADSALGQPVSVYEKPDGLRLPTGTLRNRLLALGIAYRVGKNPVHAERAWQELAAVAAFPDWNPAHFLDAAGIMQAFAIGYDWFHGYWTPARRKILRDAMLAKGLKPAQARYLAQSDFVLRTNNWNHVCNGGVIMAALAIADADTSGLARYDLLEALKSMDKSGAMDAWAPDGAWVEGPGYWGFTLEYLTQALASLRSALGTTFGFEKKPGLSETGYFPIYMTSPAARSFNFADGGDAPAGNAGLFWFAREYRKPEFTWHQRKYGAGSAQALIWDAGPALSPKAANLPLDRYFRHVEVTTLREAWDDPDASWIGFKAGCPSDPHGHMDAGTFMMDALGVRWAGDFSAENYNLPAFWDYAKVRWDYYRLRAEGHNTLVLNPASLPQQDPAFRSRIVQHAGEPGKAMAIADLSEAYAGKVSRYRRGVALMKDRKWMLVQDEAQTTGNPEAYWFMHTQAEIRIDKGSAFLERDGKRLWARILSPAGAAFSVMEAAPLPVTPNPRGQSPNTGWRKLTIHLQAAGNVNITVLFVPLRPQEQPPTELPAVGPLGDGWPATPVKTGRTRFHPEANWDWKYSTHGLVLTLAGNEERAIEVRKTDGRTVGRFRAGGTWVSPHLDPGLYAITVRGNSREPVTRLVPVP